MSTARKRNEIMQDFLVRYNRGQISKQQYLEQEKRMLLEEQVEKQEIHDKAQASLDILQKQIKEIEDELAELVEQ